MALNYFGRKDVWKQKCSKETNPTNHIILNTLEMNSTLMNYIHDQTNNSKKMKDIVCSTLSASNKTNLNNLVF